MFLSYDIESTDAKLFVYNGLLKQTWCKLKPEIYKYILGSISSDVMFSLLKIIDNLIVIDI